MKKMPRKQTSIKVDPIAWEAAKKIFSEYGITASEAINIFLNRVRLEGGFPFEIKIPNDRLKKALKELEEQEVEEFDDLKDFLKDLKK